MKRGGKGIRDCTYLCLLLQIDLYPKGCQRMVKRFMLHVEVTDKEKESKKKEKKESRFSRCLNKHFHEKATLSDLGQQRFWAT